jgi:hypothetical protein
MPVPLPLVAIDRASGSVREICWSGASSTCLSIAFSDCIRRRGPSIFSLIRVVFASDTSSCRRSAWSNAAK